VPRGYHVEERHPRWAIITGISMLGSSYLVALLTATQKDCTSSYTPVPGGYSSTCDTRWVMAVPVVGPFVDLAKGDRGDRQSTDILIGGGELAGAIFLVVGLAITTTRLIPDTDVGFRVAPLLGSTTGLSFTLRN
jgi:hypothetical protein